MGRKSSISIENLYEAYAVPLVAYSDAGTLKPEELHTLRVAIKNIRAILDFSGQLLHRDFRSEFKPVLNPVFKKAGELRTLDVNLQLLKDSDKPYLRPLKSFMRKEKLHLLKNFSSGKKNLNKKQFHILSGELMAGLGSIPLKKIKKSAREFAGERLKKAARKLKNAEKTDDLHEIRKLLKTAKTVLGVLHSFDNTKKIKKQLKKLTQAESRIGDWHDKTVLADYINNYLSSHKPKGTGLPDFNKKLREGIKAERDFILSSLRKTPF